MRRSAAIVGAGSWLLVLALGCEVTIKPWDLMFQPQEYAFFEVTAAPAQVLGAAQALCRQQKVACTVAHRTINQEEVTRLRGTSPTGKPFVLLIKPDRKGDRAHLRLRWTEGADPLFEIALVSAMQHAAPAGPHAAPAGMRAGTGHTVPGKAASRSTRTVPAASASWDDRKKDEVLRVGASE